MDALTPQDIERMAAGSNETGDLRLGVKLMEFRTTFGVPRETLASLSGVSVTTITRIELGQRMVTTYSLTHLIKGARQFVKMIAPRRVRTFEKWALEMVFIVADITEAQRLERIQNGN